MTALARLLFPAPALRRSPEMLFAWWESRRPTFNVIVGGTGLLTLCVLELLSRLPPHLQPNPLRSNPIVPNRNIPGD